MSSNSYYHCIFCYAIYITLTIYGVSMLYTIVVIQAPYGQKNEFDFKTKLFLKIWEYLIPILFSKWINLLQNTC